jgi:hypothetical protein
VVPLTLENATKFSGALWLARTMFRRIDSLRVLRGAAIDVVVAWIDGVIDRRARRHDCRRQRHAQQPARTPDHLRNPRPVGNPVIFCN